MKTKKTSVNTKKFDATLAPYKEDLREILFLTKEHVAKYYYDLCSIISKKNVQVLSFDEIEKVSSKLGNDSVIFKYLDKDQIIQFVAKHKSHYIKIDSLLENNRKAVNYLDENTLIRMMKDSGNCHNSWQYNYNTKYPGLYIAISSFKNPSEKLLESIANTFPNLISGFKNLPDSIINIKLKRNPYEIQEYINSHLKLCIDFIIKNNFDFSFMHESKKLKILQEEPSLYKTLHNPSLKLSLAFVNIDGLNLKYISDQNKVIVDAAIKQNPLASVYVKDQKRLEDIWGNEVSEGNVVIANNFNLYLIMAIEGSYGRKTKIKTLSLIKTINKGCNKNSICVKTSSVEDMVLIENPLFLITRPKMKELLQAVDLAKEQGILPADYTIGDKITY